MFPTQQLLAERKEDVKIVNHHAERPTRGFILSFPFELKCLLI